MSPIQDGDVFALSRNDPATAGTYKVPASALKAYVGGANVGTGVKPDWNAQPADPAGILNRPGAATAQTQGLMSGADKAFLDATRAGNNFVAKIGDTMTGALELVNNSNVNLTGGAFTAHIPAGNTFLYAETPSAAGWCQLRFSASNNAFLETIGTKALTIGGGQVNLKAGQAQYDHGADGATFNRRLTLTNDGATFAHLFMDSWASINATDWRADYTARKELWLWAAKEDNDGYLLLAGGSGGGQPVRFGVTENQGSTPTSRQIAHVDTSGNWHNSSDRRLKEKIKPVAYGLEAVLKMKPVSFTYKASGQQTVGFIAQDLHKVVPEAVGKPEGDGDWTVAPSLLIPALVKAVQELTARVQQLEGAS